MEVDGTGADEHVDEILWQGQTQGKDMDMGIEGPADRILELPYSFKVTNKGNWEKWPGIKYYNYTFPTDYQEVGGQ